jgi:N-acetylneuraminic acid mutarotase
MRVIFSRLESGPMSASPLFWGLSANVNFFASKSTARNVGAFCLVAGLAIAGAGYSQSGGAQGSWTTRSPMPAARNEVVAVAAGDRIYVLGGNESRDSRLTRNEEYDPVTDKWRSRAPLPSGASHMAAAAINGKVYAIGGFTGRDHKGAVDRFFEYDLTSDAWRALAPLNPPRGSAGAAVLDGKIHVIGGRVTNESDDWHTNGVVATHDVYDPGTVTWTQAAPLPRARDHMVVAAVDGKLHAIGGRFSHNDDMTDLHEVYDAATGVWASAPPLPTARGGVSGTVYKGLILVLGGEDENRTYIENEAYDVKADRWFKLAPMPAGRHGHGVAAVGRSAYVVGGALQRGGGGVSAQLLAFTLP